MTDFGQSQHVIFFIDILGSSELVKSDDSERVASLTKMLSSINSTTRDFSVQEVSSNRDFSYAVPAISTFSDLILLSFDIEQMTSIIEHPYREACLAAQQLLGALAHQVLKLGMLIRGGATVGSLYQSGGAVVGKGLIEAYDLERLAARYPG